MSRPIIIDTVCVDQESGRYMAIWVNHYDSATAARYAFGFNPNDAIVALLIANEAITHTELK